MRRSKLSRDPVVIHIRTSRANMLAGVTICGEYMYDQRIREYSAKRKSASHLRLPPEADQELTVPQLFSVHINSSDRLDTPGDRDVDIMPSIKPYIPPIRFWEFCTDCWDGDERALLKLNNLDI